MRIGLQWRIPLAASCILACAVANVCGDEAPPLTEEAARLVNQLRTGTPPQRAEAAQLLAKKRHAVIVDALHRAAHSDKSLEVREAAIRALGFQQYLADAKAVAKYIDEVDGRIRAAACEAVGRLDAIDAAPALIARALADASADVRIAALWAIDRLGPPAMAQFDAAMEKLSPRELEAMRTFFEQATRNRPSTALARAMATTVPSVNIRLPSTTQPRGSTAPLQQAVITLKADGTCFVHDDVKHFNLARLSERELAEYIKELVEQDAKSAKPTRVRLDIDENTRWSIVVRVMDLLELYGVQNVALRLAGGRT